MIGNSSKTPLFVTFVVLKSDHAHLQINLHFPLYLLHCLLSPALKAFIFFIHEGLQVTGNPKLIILVVAYSLWWY